MLKSFGRALNGLLTGLNGKLSTGHVTSISQSDHVNQLLHIDFTGFGQLSHKQRPAKSVIIKDHLN